MEERLKELGGKKSMFEYENWEARKGIPRVYRTRILVEGYRSWRLEECFALKADLLLFMVRYR